LRCPWHGWEYDIKTGQSWVDPASVRVRSYDVEVASGAQIEGEGEMEGLVQGSFKAETYEVSVEEEYVIIEI